MSIGKDSHIQSETAGRVFTGLAMSLVLLLAACQTSPGSPPAPPIFGDEARLIGEIQRRWETVRSFKAEAQIFLNAEGLFVPGQLILDALKPVGIRADLRDPLGRTVTELTFVGKEVRTWVPEDRYVPIEAASLKNILIGRFKDLGGAPPAEWLASLLIGHLAADANNAYVKWQKGDEKTFIRPGGNIGTIILLTDFQARPVMKRFILVGDADRRTVTFDYDDYVMVDGRSLPMSVSVSIPYFSYRLTITYREVNINTWVYEGIF